MDGRVNTDETVEASGLAAIGQEKVEKKRLKIFGVEAVYLGILGIGTAMIGWIAENIVKAICDGVIDSRFHTLPFISPYALIPFAFALVFGKADDLTVFGRQIFKKKTAATRFMSNVIIFLMICGAVFVGEFVVGNAWDLMFGVQLWNYSNLPLQVTQYAGLIPSLGYGTGAFLLFKFAYAPLLNLLRRKANFRAAKIIAIVLGSLIVLDTLVMGLHIAIDGYAPMLWQIRLR